MAGFIFGDFQTLTNLGAWCGTEGIFFVGWPIIRSGGDALSPNVA
jgi:hypothetical protein